MSTPTPPLGYALDELPFFLRPTAATSHVVAAPSNGIAVAEVDGNDPTTIKVREPKQFTLPAETHEQTHVFQLSRNAAVRGDIAAPLQTRDPNHPMANYTYGGADGLLKAQEQGKTISDFNLEQQAEIVKGFQQETQAAMAANDPAQLDKVNRAYEPFVQQEANMPGKNDPMTSINTTPAAPGLPPSAETGIMQESPLLGNQMKIVLPAGYTLDQ